MRSIYFNLLAPLVFGIVGCAGPTAILSPAHPLDYDSASCRSTGMDGTGTDFASAMCVDMGKLTSLENKYYMSTTTSDERRLIRDQWVQILMTDIDALWWQFEGKFTGRNEMVETVSETAVTGMAAAAAGVTGTAGKTALAVMSATLNGFNASFDKNVLQQQAMPTLFNAAKADRFAVETEILAGLKVDATQYSLTMASRDVLRYAQAGTLTSALASINQKVGVASANATTARTDVVKSKTK